MIKSTVSMTDLSEITRRFDELPDVLKGRAVRRATERTFVKARKDAVAVLRNSYRVRSSDLKQASFRIDKALGQMEIVANRIGLGYFNPMQRPDGVKVSITQTTASRIELNKDNIFVPSTTAKDRQRFIRRGQQKVIKGAFIIPKSKMKYTSGMRPGEMSGVFVREKTGQISATVNSRGKAKATRVKRIRRLFTISTAEMIASGQLSQQINNTIVNEFSRIYEQELRGFVQAVALGRIKKL